MFLHCCRWAVAVARKLTLERDCQFPRLAVSNAAKAVIDMTSLHTNQAAHKLSQRTGSTRPPPSEHVRKSWPWTHQSDPAALAQCGYRCPPVTGVWQSCASMYAPIPVCKYLPARQPTANVPRTSDGGTQPLCGSTDSVGDGNILQDAALRKPGSCRARHKCAAYGTPVWGRNTPISKVWPGRTPRHCHCTRMRTPATSLDH